MKSFGNARLNGLSAAANYARFPCLKHFFPFEAGSVTTQAIDVVNGVKFVSRPWTQNSRNGAFMQTPSETSWREHISGTCGHHNAFLTAGKWAKPLRKSSIWLLCGKFDGMFTFGFGDSNVTGHEVVFTQSLLTAGCLMNGDRAVFFSVPSNFAIDATSPGLLDASTISLCGLAVNEEAGLFEFFITDVNGDYQYVTRLISDYPNYSGLSYDATYSMGRDVVTSADTGIVDLTNLTVFTFESMPSDYRTALPAMRTEWAAGRKAYIWEGWAGRAAAIETYISPVPGATSLVANSVTQVTISHSGQSHSSGILHTALYHSNGGGIYTLLNSSATFPYVHSGLTTGSHNYYFVRVIANDGSAGVSEQKYVQTP